MDYKEIVSDSFSRLITSSITQDADDKAVFHYRPFTHIPEEVIFSLGESAEEGCISLELVCERFCADFLDIYEITSEELISCFDDLLENAEDILDDIGCIADRDCESVTMTRSVDIPEDGSEIAKELFRFTADLAGLREVIDFTLESDAMDEEPFSEEEDF